MTRTKRQPRQTRGFSLIEMMVVMVIIAMMAMAVTFVIPDDRDDQAAKSARDLHTQLQYAREYAMVRHAVLALEVWEQDYRFVQWQDSRWQPINTKGLTAHELPEHLRFELDVDSVDLLAQDADRDGLFQPVNDEDEADKQQRQPGEMLYIFGSGGLPVFSLKFINMQDATAASWVVESTDGYQLQVRSDVD
ncbi:pilus assembly FimT family protein [Pseudidiomarina salinarum]|uniref:pilus assembly FimT family protein n=1 Tax=Pseudidiomarina salinarum TaxID=435908 RepID=UPI00068CA1BA|nr:GspH/FimT family pseudopilin [Pseudidiomarina salinarum]